MKCRVEHIRTAHYDNLAHYVSVNPGDCPPIFKFSTVIRKTFLTNAFMIDRFPDHYWE